MSVEDNKCTNCRWIYSGELICICPSSDYKGQDVSGLNTDDCTQFVHWDELEMLHKGDGELFE